MRTREPSRHPKHFVSISLPGGRLSTATKRAPSRLGAKLPTTRTLPWPRLSATAMAFHAAGSETLSAGLLLRTLILLEGPQRRATSELVARFSTSCRRYAPKLLSPRRLVTV